MTKPDQLSDSELEDTSKITDPASCLDYLKRREVFLYKMINDPSHKSMLYFLEVLMNAETPLSVEQMAARFTNKAFSEEMREACGGGSVDALRDFLLKYPSLFSVKPNGLVSAVSIDVPSFDEMSEGSIDVDFISSGRRSSGSSMGRAFHRTASFSSVESAEKTNPGTPRPLKSSLKNSHSAEVKPVGIYQPPVLRAQAAAAAAAAAAATTRKTSFCEICSMATHVATTSATTVVHCPFADLHHYNQHHHHHNQTPRCNQSSLRHTHSTGHCCCNGESTASTASHCRNSGNSSKSLASCSFMETFALETEAVKFFQQRLINREERWVQIKSLAGHLSQASAEVRSIVGPQLEFRRFLVKHPHVFEVQGDLVGLRDHFSATCLSSSSSSALRNRPKSFVGSTNSIGFNSQSATSLSALNARSGQSQRTTRPKSFIMLSQAPTNATPIRRLESIPTRPEYYSTCCTREVESMATSDPNSTQAPRNRPNPSTPGSRQRANGTNRFSSATQQDTVTSSVRHPTRGPRGQEGDAASSTGGSICIRMSANEYRAIMFLRKVLAKKGGASDQLGLSYVQLVQILSAKAPEAVQSAIGWTKVELEEFILQHPIFFEIHDCSDVARLQERPLPESSVTWALGDNAERPSTLVTNRRVLKMINIVITDNKPLDAGTRTMTNRCGRVFHVAKLWGIIDLGKHEHVFFDKSILKYVDDLQKHFKVNEAIYFNAILAPKESRAKWRATQVWKECDKEIMEKYGVGSFNGRTASASVAKVSTPGMTSETDKSHNMTLNSDSSDYGLVDDEEVDEEEQDVGAANAIARAEGLHLANDIKFLSDDVEAELERILGPNRAVTTTTGNNQPDGQPGLYYASDEDTILTGCIDDISINFSDTGSLSEHDVARITRITPKTQKSQQVTAADSPVTERPSIAVQTLFTGDIMATQIFHDMK